MSGRRLVWILLPLLAVTLALEVRSAARRWQASRILAVVRAVTLEAEQRGRLTPRLLERNVELLRRAESWSPVEVALPIARGGQYLLLGRPRPAVRAFEKALAIEPRGEVFAHLGRALLQAGDRAAAEQALRTAALLDHSLSRHLELLEPARRGGRTDGGSK